MEHANRLVALDAFRGLTIAGMILVNTPGSWSFVYPPFRHAVWHGCSPTDLVFPFFLFIVGTAMWFSFKKLAALSHREVVPKILRRTAIIFFIGLALGAFPFIRDYTNFRYMGVLQRIGLAYGLAALLVHFLNRRALWVTVVGLLLGYWALLWGLGGAEPYSLEGNVGVITVANPPVNALSQPVRHGVGGFAASQPLCGVVERLVCQGAVGVSGRC